MLFVMFSKCFPKQHLDIENKLTVPWFSVGSKLQILFLKENGKAGAELCQAQLKLELANHTVTYPVENCIGSTE